jgi:hypothetical protein
MDPKPIEREEPDCLECSQAGLPGGCPECDRVGPPQAPWGVATDPWQSDLGHGDMCAWAAGIDNYCTCETD